MGLKHIKTGEMIDIFRDWQIEEKIKILQAYRLTEAYPETIASTFESLSKAEADRQPSLSEEERRKLSKLLGELDGEFDQLARVVDTICQAFGLAFPERRAEYEEVREVILPDGLSIINTSYRNEAGETTRMAERLEANAEAKKTVAETTLNDVNFSHWVERILDVGRRIGPIAARYDVQESRAQEVLLEFQMRQQWMKVVTTLRRTAHLAGWTAEHHEAIFGQVDRIAASRDKVRDEEGPGGG